LTIFHLRSSSNASACVAIPPQTHFAGTCEAIAASGQYSLVLAAMTLTLSAAVCAGYAHGYGASKGSVPPQARYYIGSGGLRPVRGYATDTAGGTFTLVVNLFELNIPVYKWISFTLFSMLDMHGKTSLQRH
jgi:outer membrane protein assembly factor BamA